MAENKKTEEITTGEMTFKDEFINIFNEKIKREGSDKLLEWLKKSDFFTAPASTRFHLCEEGGLVQHSLNVYKQLVAEAKIYEEQYGQKVASDESIAIVALLHDVCKVNFYKVEFRNRKNNSGVWEEVPFYTVEDGFPLGHGEKSLVVVSTFLNLNSKEMMAIRWHMGGFDESVKGGSYSISNAFEKFPLAVLTSVADVKATYLDEV